MKRQESSLGVLDNEVILRRPAVLVMTGLSDSSLLRLERTGEFPRARRIGGRTVGWLQGEVREWLRSRPLR
jgi:prophage regulatory protein